VGDKLCFDQDNPKEKGHQVVMMADIFSRANLVFIWLGRPTAYTATAMDLLLALRADEWS